MGRLEILTGKRFGSWLVLEEWQRINNATHWLCQCNCGNEVLVAASSLKSGMSTQCQICASTKHGMCGRFKEYSTSREYDSWAAAKSRCTNPNNPKYEDYGGRGITMCDEWLNSFEAFYNHIGECPPGLIIDRIDNDRGYEPGNVRWVTYSESNKNRRKK